MKSSAKRVLAALLSTTMIATMVAGCSDQKPAENPPAESKDTPAAESKDEPAAPSGEAKEIIFWNISTEGLGQKINDDAVQRYNDTANTGYKITSVATQNDQYKQKLTVAMSSGQCPNIYTHWSGGPMNEYIDSGFAVDISSYMEKDGFKDQFLDAAIAQSTYKDKLYAVPFQNCSVAGVFYNKEMYEKYSLTVPKTLAEFEKNCDTLKENGIIPFALANASKWTGSMYFMYFASRMGGLEPFNEAVAGTGSFENDAFKYAGEKVQDWVDKGYFPEGVNGLDEDAGQAKQLMYTEEAAMQLHGSWMIGTYKTDSEEFYQKMGWFPFPAIEGGIEDTSIIVGTIGDNFLSFYPADDAMLDASFEFAKFYTDETADKIRIDGGNIPPKKGVEVTDPIMKQVFDAVQNASSVQLWYDQYLPPAVTDVHLSTCQELFGKTMTPEDADKKFQAAMQEYLATKK